MQEPKNKYILLHNRTGYNLERNLFTLGLTTTSTPTQVLRGELLESLPEAEQPLDLTRIAVVGIDRKSLRLECRTEDLARLSDEDANLLLAIFPFQLRFDTFIDRLRMDFGRRVEPYSQVFVSVEGISKDLPGIVWYKGELPSRPGTMFGIELIVSKLVSCSIYIKDAILTRDIIKPGMLGVCKTRNSPGTPKFFKHR